MGAKPRIPDCRTCGACCVAPYEQDRFCDLTAADIKQLPKSAKSFVVYDSPLENFFFSLAAVGAYGSLATKTATIARGPLQGIEATTCACLDGNVLDGVSCCVYPDRPAICRTSIQPGDRNCRAIRQQLFVLAQKSI